MPQTGTYSNFEKMKNFLNQDIVVSNKNGWPELTENFSEFSKLGNTMEKFTKKDTRLEMQQILIKNCNRHKKNRTAQDKY